MGVGCGRGVGRACVEVDVAKVIGMGIDVDVHVAIGVGAGVGATMAVNMGKAMDMGAQWVRWGMKGPAWVLRGATPRVADEGVRVVVERDW